MNIYALLWLLVGLLVIIFTVGLYSEYFGDGSFAFSPLTGGISAFLIFLVVMVYIVSCSMTTSDEITYKEISSDLLEELDKSRIVYSRSENNYVLHYNYGLNYIEIKEDSSKSAQSRQADLKEYHWSGPFYRTFNKHIIFLSSADYELVTDWVDEQIKLDEENHDDNFLKLTEKDKKKKSEVSEDSEELDEEETLDEARLDDDFFFLNQ